MTKTRRSGFIADWEIDASGSPPAVPDDAAIAYLLLRRGGRPVGRLVLEPPFPKGPEPLRTLALETIAADPDSGRNHEPGVDAEKVTVVIATRDRPDDLDRALAALRALDPPPGEIVVADSASADREAVAEVGARHRARLVRLDRPGLSVARNAGARAASRPYVAFLDDDCRADRSYMNGVTRGFADTRTWAVTGQLLPAELDTEAQRLFLRYAHMDRRGFAPRRFDGAHAESRHWPLDAWRMGSGGNLAVRRDAFDRLGGFATSLGLGTPARGGEDLFLLWSMIRAGGRVVYRPDAMAWHRHHRDLGSLRRVMFGYGVGHRAFLRAAARAGAPRWRLLDYTLSFWFDRSKRLLRAWAGLWRIPPGLVVREAAGQLAGGHLARQAERDAA